MSDSFRLYEALLWEPQEGYFLLERHLERLSRSARHFDFPDDSAAVRARLEAHAAGLGAQPRKVRLELSADGTLWSEDVDVKPSVPVRMALAADPVDSSDEFLAHKTSRREVYERASAGRPDADDVLLWNERRELTESPSSNLLLELEGRLVTPTASSGLLPGTFRAHLLDAGEIEEAIVPVTALRRAARLWLLNSVRRRYEATLAATPGG